MWEVAILEMGWLGPILDLKLIAVFSFFTTTITDNMKHQKLDKIRNYISAI